MVRKNRVNHECPIEESKSVWIKERDSNFEFEKTFKIILL